MSMQTPVQGDLARIWKHWKRIQMDPCIQTHSYHWLGIWFPHHISCQAQSSPIVLIMLLYVSPASVHLIGIFSFINFLVYSVHLFSLTLSFYALFGVSSQNFKLFFILILVFLTHIFNSQKIKILLKKNQGTTNLTGDGWQSPLLLTFSGAILGPLLFISVLLLPALSFQAPSLLHRGPNPLQLGCIPLLALYQVPETSWLFGTPPQAPGVPFQWHSGPYHK